MSLTLEKETKQIHASLGKGPLAREVILGLLPLAISLVVIVTVIVGAIDLTAVLLLDVGNRSLTQVNTVEFLH